MRKSTRLLPGPELVSVALSLAQVLLIGVAGLLVAGQSASAQADVWACSDVATPAPQGSPVPAATRVAVSFPADGGSLTVFAAASLTDAFLEMGADIQEANPNVEITFNVAGSQALVTQIAEGGAEADVLAVASLSQMRNAVESGIPADDAATFVTNRLTIVVPADNPAGITNVEDLAKDGVRLVLAGSDVPAGAYARKALCNVAATGSAPGVDEFAANIVSEEDNVRSVLTKVQLGEADAGIVYVTDALTAGEAVRTIDIAPERNVLASYPIAAIRDNPLARAFISYVFSPDGQATLASYGFDPVE